MQAHRFKVGTTVRFTPSALDKSAQAGNYRIVRHLPADGTDNQYRIKSVSDGHERVVKEGQLA
jgi:hypothetical protein